MLVCEQTMTLFLTFLDPALSPTCIIKKNFLSQNYLGAYLKMQPAQGCTTSYPAEEKEVHVIELESPSSSTYR